MIKKVEYMWHIRSVIQRIQEHQYKQIRRIPHPYKDPIQPLTEEWWDQKTHILLDMDGTLIQQSETVFYTLSLALIGRIGRLIGSYQTAFKAIQKAYQSLFCVDKYHTNKEAFVATLTEYLGTHSHKVERILQDLIAIEMNILSRTIGGFPIAKELVKRLKKQKKTLVLATNPLGGHDIIQMRLIRSDLRLLDFDYVTSWENSRGLKPQNFYYESILSYMNIAPEQAVMIGNDRFYDSPHPSLRISSLILSPKLTLEDIVRSLPSC